MNNAWVRARAGDATLLQLLDNQPLHVDLLLQRLQRMFLGPANASNKQPRLQVPQNNRRQAAQTLKLGRRRT